MSLPSSWALIPIPRGTKGPTAKGWNLKENCKLPPNCTGNTGLAHTFSGTCAIDFDNLAEATAWLAERKIDAAQLLEALDAVQISSGRPNRAKLLYRLDTPLRSIKVAPFINAEGKTRKALEFRCGDAKGGTVQDVLPPSIHPDTGKPYEWKLGPLADLEALPQLPEALHRLWLSLIEAPAPAPVEEPVGFDAAALRAIIAEHDAEDYDTWLKVGMALHHETQGADAGLALWDNWSSTASNYKSFEDLEHRWRGFGGAANPVTINSLKGPTVSKVEDFEVLSDEPTTEALKPERFRVVPAPEFQKGKRLDWIIRGVIPKAELIVIYGESGSGKTFVTLDMVAAVATGRAWRELVTTHGRVVYICAEGIHGFRQRLKAYSQQYQVVLDALGIIPDSPNFLEQADPLAIAKSIIASGGASIIVVDTLSAVAAGGNENAGEDMGRVLLHCKGLHRATGAAVILIHHSGKDAAKGARGWSGLRAAADAEFEVTSSGDYRVLSTTKMKDADGDAEYGFKLVPIAIDQEDDGTPISSCFIEATAVSSRQVEEEPKGTNQKLVYAAAKTLLAERLDGEPVDAGEVIRAARDLMAWDGTDRDRRSKRAAEALDGLVACGFLRQEHGRVSLA